MDATIGPVLVLVERATRSGMDRFVLKVRRSVPIDFHMM